MPTADDQRRTKVLVLANPTAGRRGRVDLIEPLLQLLREHGIQGEVITDLERVSERAADCLEDGTLRAFVAAGGDGTVAEIVNRTPAETPIAVLPLGTANLLAKYLGVRRDIQAIATTILARRMVQLDAASANGRFFFLMASAGFDAAVVQRIARTRAGALSYWSYAKPIWQEIRSYEYPELRVYCSGPAGDAAIHIAARWAWVVNIPAYAGGLHFAPRASPTDAMLDVCTLAGGGLWRSLSYLPYLWLARPEQLADCRLARAMRVRIEADGPTPYQLDGDPGGMLPLEIEVAPQRLSLIVPETFRLSAPGQAP